MRSRIWIGTGLMIGLTAAGIVISQQTASADGITTASPMYYGGVLEVDSQRVDENKSIQLYLWDDAVLFEEAHRLCSTIPTMPTPVIKGAFRIALSDTCTEVVQEHPDLWVEIVVESMSLGRVKIGAAPFAVEASRAAAASGPLDERLKQLMPPKTVVNVFLTPAEIAATFDASGLGAGDYLGWAICNGNNGTPDLGGRFVRGSATGAGTTGGSDSGTHTHPIDHNHAAFNSTSDGNHTHTTPAHQHVLPIGYDTTFWFIASDAAGTPLYGSSVINTDRATPGIGGTAGNGLARLAWTQNDGASNTGSAGAHTHSIDVPAFSGSSGPATTDNRPAYTELVPLMRL